MSTVSIAAVSFTLAGAASASGIGETNLRAAADRGDLICHWVNSKRVIRAIDLDEYIQSLPTERPRR